jgi:hypothetical protein
MSAAPKFPRTAHLADLGGSGVTRDDLVLSAGDAARLLGAGALVLEEKVDGANLALWLDPSWRLCAQNRSHAVSAATGKQWAGLDSWTERHRAALFDLLARGGPGRLVLYGEWCAARHSVPYDALPDWFLAFDVWDARHERFLSAAARDALLADAGLATAPRVATGRWPTVAALAALLEVPSALRRPDRAGAAARAPAAGPPARALEGLYLRLDEQAPLPAAPAGRAEAGAGAAAVDDGGERGDDDPVYAGVPAAFPDAAAGVVWGRFLRARAKLVRPDFLAGIDEHWTSRVMEKNQLLPRVDDADG